MPILNLQVAKWGNSLALRLPAVLVRRIGLKAGDSVEARLTADGGMSLRPSTWDRKAFLAELDAARRSMPQGKSVLDEVRRGGPY